VPQNSLLKLFYQTMVLKNQFANYILIVNLD